MNIDAFDRELKKANITVKPFTSQFMFDAYLGPEIVSNVLPDIMEILRNPKSINYDSKLAGQLLKGSQIEIDKSQYTNSIAGLKDIIEEISLAYVNRWFSYAYGKNTIHNSSFQGKVELSEFWINEQFADDYNPIHSHTTKSTSGLSGVFYLQEPEYIEPGIGPFGMTCVNSAGKIQVIFGTNITVDPNNFRLTEMFTFNPTPGRLILFPVRQPHQVDPFRGKGSRICLAFNVSVWWGQKGITPWADGFLDLILNQKSEHE